MAPAPAPVSLTLEQANRLATLPLECLQTAFPYKSGLVISKAEDLRLPRAHHPAFYGCFDWHSAVHGHWSLVYLLRQFPALNRSADARRILAENLTAENIRREIEYFSLNPESTSFERTYGWAWLLKLQQELNAWDDSLARELAINLQPLTDHISAAYQAYLPKLIYPIRVGEHSNTAFGLSFAHDYAVAAGNTDLEAAVVTAARRFYLSDAKCPIGWEPSGYDFLSPCLQEMDIMRKVLPGAEFQAWSRAFLPALFAGTLDLEPGRVADRSDGKLVHLDGLNFSRAWCLYSLDDAHAERLANEHLAYSLDKITDGEYAGQHWLASFALYAFQQQNR